MIRITQELQTKGFCIVPGLVTDEINTCLGWFRDSIKIHLSRLST